MVAGPLKAAQEAAAAGLPLSAVDHTTAGMSHDANAATGSAVPAPLPFHTCPTPSQSAVLQHHSSALCTSEGSTAAAAEPVGRSPVADCDASADKTSVEWAKLPAPEADPATADSGAAAEIPDDRNSSIAGPRAAAALTLPTAHCSFAGLSNHFAAAAGSAASAPLQHCSAADLKSIQEAAPAGCVVPSVAEHGIVAESVGVNVAESAAQSWSEGAPAVADPKAAHPAEPPVDSATAMEGMIVDPPAGHVSALPQMNDESAPAGDAGGGHSPLPHCGKRSLQHAGPLVHYLPHAFTKLGHCSAFSLGCG